MLNRTRRVAISGLLFSLFAAACGSTSTGPAAGASPTGETVLPPSPLVGEFETLSDGTIDLAQFQGEDVVLWFWAPW